jgi:cobalt/nickel transport protein
MRTRTSLLGGLLVALLIAGFGSYYASSHPDGLSFVAEKTGFIDEEKESPTADGPFAGYQTKGVDNDRLSGGLAGLTGALVVLVLGGGLFWLVRRRPDDDTAAKAPGA